MFSDSALSDSPHPIPPHQSPTQPNQTQFHPTPVVPGLPLAHSAFSRFGHVTYVTTAVNCGKLVGLLSKRFEILERIRVEAEGGQEEEDIARDPHAVMSRESWPAPCWKVSSLRRSVCRVVLRLRRFLEDDCVRVFFSGVVLRVVSYCCCCVNKNLGGLHSGKCALLDS